MSLRPTNQVSIMNGDNTIFLTQSSFVFIPATGGLFEFQLHWFIKQLYAFYVYTDPKYNNTGIRSIGILIITTFVLK